MMHDVVTTQMWLRLTNRFNFFPFRQIPECAACVIDHTRLAALLLLLWDVTFL